MFKIYLNSSFAAKKDKKKKTKTKYQKLNSLQNFVSSFIEHRMNMTQFQEFFFD